MTEEVCEGHKIGGQLIFRGVDYSEMAAQLLGVWLAQEIDHYPSLNGKIVSFKKSSFHSMNPVFPGDLLRVEILVKEHDEKTGEEGNPRIEIVGRGGMTGKSSQKAICTNAGAWVGNVKKAMVYLVILNIVDAKNLKA